MTGVTAVFDVGKTNAKLCGVDDAGRVVRTDAVRNRVLPGPPYDHHDLAGMEAWLAGALRRLNAAHRVTAIVPCAHGGSGVLVDDDGPVMPMIDYEQAPPPALSAAYRAEADPWRDRGSAVMLGAAHAARQLMWLEAGWPEAVGRARAYLPAPQYWSWRLSGVMADEVTSAAAQSHLWSVANDRPAAIVARRGWQRLMAPMRPAYARLSPLLPAWAAATGIDPATPVINGMHDSSANFYRYQSAGLSDFTLVSTGTWIVGLTDRDDPQIDKPRPGRNLNADIHGRPVPGMLCMGGREFQAASGDASGPADAGILARLVASNTMALPFMDQDDSLFPGRARRGEVVGPMKRDAGARFTLAVLYVASLTAEVVDALPRAERVILDGTFVLDRLYGAVLQRLLPDREVLVNADPAGVAAGAAALAWHGSGRQQPLDLTAPDTRGVPDLRHYRALWLERLAMQEETIP